MKTVHNMPPTFILGEINISQTHVKSPQATESIFYRQEVIKSLDPALPVFEAGRSPVVSRREDGSAPSPSGFGPVHNFSSYRKELELIHLENLGYKSRHWDHRGASGDIFLPTTTRHSSVSLPRPRVMSEARRKDGTGWGITLTHGTLHRQHWG